MSEKPSYKEVHGVTRIGKFLKDAADKGQQWAPGLLDIAATITGREGLSKLADKIRKSDDVPELDKEVSLKLIEKDVIEAQEETKRIIAEYDHKSVMETQISERWKADMSSDDKISKLTRPLLVLAWSLFSMVMIIVDSVNDSFEVPEYWVNIIATMLITTVGGYFIVREISKRNKLKFLTK